MAHYLGARMIQTMDRVHPRNAIVDCVRSMARFLPLYSEAAREVGGFVYDPKLVGQCNQLWGPEPAPEE